MKEDTETHATGRGFWKGVQTWCPAALRTAGPWPAGCGLLPLHLLSSDPAGLGTTRDEHLRAQRWPAPHGVSRDLSKRLSAK